MKSNMKYIVAILFVVAAVFVAKLSFFPTDPGAKTIEITIINQMTDEELYHDTVNTDAETLGELLDEESDLLVVYQNSDFGRFITSMLGVEQGDINSGPWWLYDSPNNEVCSTSGYCPGVDDLPILDNDQFIFNYTNQF